MVNYLVHFGTTSGVWEYKDAVWCLLQQLVCYDHSFPRSVFTIAHMW